eukprot:2409090-Pyramimonas_sp.AAC.1
MGQGAGERPGRGSRRQQLPTRGDWESDCGLLLRRARDLLLQIAGGRLADLRPLTAGLCDRVKGQDGVQTKAGRNHTAPTLGDQ